MLSFPFRQPGIAAALASAALFGAGTPLAKWLLDDVGPWMLAGLLYLGSGLGLGLYRLARRMKSPTLQRAEWGWLALAVLLGGGIGPVLLMWGLSGLSASHAALLLNAEAVFTALLAWGLFRENVDRRVALGMVAIVAGALALSWPAQGLSGDAVPWSALGPALSVLGACLAWGLDNNLTRKVSLNDASWIACVKGLVAGGVNLALALWAGSPLPGAGPAFAAMGVGLAGLRREPGAVRAGPAPPGGIACRGLFFDRALCRGAGGGAAAGGSGDGAAGGRRGPDGGGCVAAPDRAPRPPAPPRSGRARTHAPPRPPPPARPHRRLAAR